MERFKLKEINEMEFKEKYDLKISNRFAAVQNLYDTGDINSALENIRKITKQSGRESRSDENSSKNHILMNSV